MESYIFNKKNFYTTILESIQNSEDTIDEKNFEILSTFLNKEGTDTNREDFEELLKIIKSIGDNYHRDQSFKAKIEQILHHYQNQIKQTFSNEEIFHLFDDNKFLLLYLFQSGILTMTETICDFLMNKIESNGNRLCHFFYTELEKFQGEEKMKDVKDSLLQQNPKAFENYEEKRQNGHNHSKICTMIRNDSVEEFISYISRKNYSLSSQITPSIFETNSFLIKKIKTTLIEYAAFYGSIQIFQYLLMSGAEITSSLWLYVIHSKNPEMIHLLESNNVSPPEFEYEKELNYSNNKFLKCFVESIKCHHNDFADYIENNLLTHDEKDSIQEEKIISTCIKYHNYIHFETESVQNHGFFYLYYYKYDNFVKLLLENNKDKINNRII